MTEIPDLKVTPDRYLTYRYAGASGDFNPIHIDEEFAKSVGLPGRILHGLWTMSQVARAVSQAGERQATRGPVPRHGLPRAGDHRHRRRSPTKPTAWRRSKPRPSRTAAGSSARARPRWFLDSEGMLSPRQELLLGKVVDGFAESGQPVGSKALAADPDIGYGPSTIRNELAVLEEQGLLAHPHTSAGRVPTDSGYRYFVDHVLPKRTSTAVAPRAVELTLARREVAEAMRMTTETLSQVTNLLAIVTAPPIATTTIRHVEVLALQPQVLMVVIITSTGGVSKRVFAFESPVDPGLAEWAAAYLNEQLVGMGLGARMLHAPARGPVAAADRARVPHPARARLHRARRDGGGHAVRRRRGAAAVASTASRTCRSSTQVMEMLERRVTLLSVLSEALAERDLYVRIGQENAAPALRGPVAGRRQLRAAAAQPRHGLGDRADAHGLRRRDPVRARRRGPALALRRRRLRRVLMARDYYETLGVDRSADDATIKKAFRQARARAAPGRQRARPRRRGEVQGGRGGLRGAQRPGAAAALRRLRRGRAARARLRAGHGRVRLGLRPVLGVLRRRAGSTLLRRRRRRPARARRRDPGRRRGRDRLDRPRRVRARQDGRDRLRGGGDVPALHGNGAEPGTPIVACATLRRHRPAPARGADGVRPARADRGAATSAAATAGSRRRRATSATARAWCAEQRRVAVDIPPGIADGQRIRLTRRGHAGQRGGPAGRPLRGRAGARGRALPARRRGPRDGDRRRRRRWRRSARPCRSRRSTATCRSRSRPGTQPGETIVHARPRAAAAARAAARATCAWWSTWRSRAGSRASSATLLEDFAATVTETTCAPTRACWPSSSGAARPG